MGSWIRPELLLARTGKSVTLRKQVGAVRSSLSDGENHHVPET